MLNSVILMGRLTADPELRTTQSGNEVTSFCIANERPFSKDKNAKTADFINIVAWNNEARFVCNYFRKGQMIAIDGRVQTRRYQDQDGNNRTAFEILAQEVHFCGGKPAEKKQTFTEGGVGDTGFATATPADFDEITGDEEYC